ncbi:8239_t:CDS:1, partial [Gigaspora rosea]
ISKFFLLESFSSYAVITILMAQLVSYELYSLVELTAVIDDVEVDVAHNTYVSW